MRRRQTGAGAGGAKERIAGFFNDYTKDLNPEDVRRLFTHDTRDAYRFFTRHLDERSLEGLPAQRRWAIQAQRLFHAFTMKLSPARRVVYGAALIFAALGFFTLMRFRLASGSLGSAVRSLPGIGFPDGTGLLLLAFALLNLLVLLEVADRLSLKNDLEIAREIQQAMLPSGVYSAQGVETLGLSRPANTVGGDFYDIIPLGDGRLAIAVGDVAGKGSPAALLMALLLAMMRTLVDEGLEPADLMPRLNAQVGRHAPGSRFITLFFGVYQPAGGELTYVNAGHMPPLVLRADGSCERLSDGGIALGMFSGSTYKAGRTLLQAGDLLAVYSDGISEAESPTGQPFDEQGLESVLRACSREALGAIGADVVRAVERHTDNTRFADDLTILLLRAQAMPMLAMS